MLSKEDILSVEISDGLIPTVRNLEIALAPYIDESELLEKVTQFYEEILELLDTDDTPATDWDLPSVVLHIFIPSTVYSNGVDTGVVGITASNGVKQDKASWFAWTTANMSLKTIAHLATMQTIKPTWFDDLLKEGWLEGFFQSLADA